MHATYVYDAKYFLFIMEGSVRKVGFKKRFFLVFFRIDHTHTHVLVGTWNVLKNYQNYLIRDAVPPPFFLVKILLSLTLLLESK